MGGVKPGHAARQGDGQRLQREKHDRQPKYRAAAETAGQPVIEQHYGEFQHRHKAAEGPHTARITAHMAHHVDQEVVGQVMGEIDQGCAQQQQAEAAVFPNKAAQRDGGFSAPGSGQGGPDAGKTQSRQRGGLKQQNGQSCIGQHKGAHALGQQAQQQYTHRVENRAEAPGCRVIHRPSPAAQLNTQLSEHGVAADAGADIQHIQRRHRDALPRQQDQKQQSEGLGKKQCPAYRKNAHAICAVHKGGQGRGEQQTENIAQSHYQTKLQIAVAPALKIDSAIAYRRAQPHPVKALKQRVCRAGKLFFIHCRASQDKLPADYSTGGGQLQGQARSPGFPFRKKRCTG